MEPCEVGDLVAIDAGDQVDLALHLPEQDGDVAAVFMYADGARRLGTWLQNFTASPFVAGDDILGLLAAEARIDQGEWCACLRMLSWECDEVETKLFTVDACVLGAWLVRKADFAAPF